MAEQVMKRWGTFLEKIQERFEQLMTETEQGCLALLDLSNLDPTPMSNAWTAMRSQVIALSAKVEDTWGEKVYLAFADAGADQRVIDAQMQRGDDLRELMEVECERREVVIFAEAARRISEEARRIMAKEFRCTQCGAGVEMPAKLHRSLHVTCDFCKRANTFEPGARVRMVEAFCCHRLAQKASWDAWVALHRAERARRRSRSETIEHLRAVEEATKVYWRAYYQARAEVVPDYADDLEKDIASRVQAFYDEMKRNETWQAAGHAALRTTM